MCGTVGLVTKGKKPVSIGVHLHDELNEVQHRGFESAGISYIHDGDGNTIKGLGPVNTAIPFELIRDQKGSHGIAQNRYSTTGTGVTTAEKNLFRLGRSETLSWKKNAQPFYQNSLRAGYMAIVHNGNLTNASQLQKRLQLFGIKLKGTSDTEVILKLIIYYIEYAGKTVVESVKAAMAEMQGAYSCILLTEEGLIAFRDPNGFRPLEIGQNDDFFFFASEACAWHKMNGAHIGEVAPAQIVEAKIGHSELIKHDSGLTPNLTRCIFCYMYLLAIYSPLVKKIRDDYGYALFSDHPFSGLIIPMMVSGEGAANGYSFAQSMSNEHIGFFDNVIYKDPGTTRSFLESAQADRELLTKIKYHWLLPQITQKIMLFATKVETIWFIIIDDSLIRGTVSKIIIKLIKEIIHESFPELEQRIKIAWLVSSPPYKYPCYMGIDTYDIDTLIANRKERELLKKLGHKPDNNQIIEAIREEIGVDYLGYLDIDIAKKITAEALGVKTSQLCAACFDNLYPIEINPKQDKMCLQ